MTVLCKASKLRDMHDDDVEFVADKYFDGNTPKSIKEALDEKAEKDHSHGITDINGLEDRLDTLKDRLGDVEDSLGEKADKDDVSPALVNVTGFDTYEKIQAVISAGNIPYYLHTFGVGAGGVSVNLYYAGSFGGRDGIGLKFIGNYDTTSFETTFQSKSNSFDAVTGKIHLLTTDTINATTINGHRIVVGSLGTDPNTIYIF